MDNQDDEPEVIEYQLVGNSTGDLGNSTSTTPTAPSKGWLGLDSTQLLIVFLIIVFAVLSLFLLIYYYIIKGMRQRSINKLAQKSISGSIGEGKDRNIFAHPERQMAVDQSTRASSHSPTSSSELDQAGTSSAAQGNSTMAATSNNSSAPTTGMQQSAPVANSSKQSSNNSANRPTVQPVSILKPTQQAVSLNKPPASTSTSKSKDTPNAESSASRKSSSESKRRRRERQQDAEHDSTSILGALAGLRDTLKETDLHK